MKRSPENDPIHLKDMLDWALEAREQVDGETRGSFERDRRLQLALMHVLATVGEAASKVTVECRTEHSQIPWANIVGMRNRLIHNYREVVLQVVWDTVAIDIPYLISELQRILEDDKH